MNGGYEVLCLSSVLPNFLFPPLCYHFEPVTVSRVHSLKTKFLLNSFHNNFFLSIIKLNNYRGTEEFGPHRSVPLVYESKIQCLSGKFLKEIWVRVYQRSVILR